MIVVDTNILSFELRRDTRAALYERHLHNQERAISFVTVAELHYGARKRNWGERRLHDLDATLRPYPVVYPDETVCRIWAEIVLTRERIGRPISENDAWIAACALRADSPLVTHNRKDFELVSGLQIISENI
jgi:tRNA(fMet)-specific endonuclease VapC